MTKEEALHFLGLSAGEVDTLVDRLEEELFEHKKFILSMNPVIAVLKKRVEKINVLNEISRVFQLDDGGHIISEGGEFKEQKSLKDFYREYEQKNARIKTTVAAASTPMQLMAAVNQLIKLKAYYYERFSKFVPPSATGKDEPVVVLGKEPDAMELLEAIKEWEETGRIPLTLQREAIRVSKLREMQEKHKDGTNKLVD